MLHDGPTLKATASPEFDHIAAQIGALREEMARLANSITATAERRGRKMATSLSHGFGDALHAVERRGQDAETEIERSVTTHPLLALGLAAGAGLLIGLLTRR